MPVQTQVMEILPDKASTKNSTANLPGAVKNEESHRQMVDNIYQNAVR
jgi:hypothetical protein